MKQIRSWRKRKSLLFSTDEKFTFVTFCRWWCKSTMAPLYCLYSHLNVEWDKELQTQFMPMHPYSLLPYEGPTNLRQSSCSDAWHVHNLTPFYRVLYQWRYGAKDSSSAAHLLHCPRSFLSLSLCLCFWLVCPLGDNGSRRLAWYVYHEEMLQQRALRMYIDFCMAHHTQ